MKYVSRKDLGWPASAAPVQSVTPKGVKIHYEGSPVPKVDHSKCTDRWKAIRKAHLNHPTEDYSDVAYNWAVCDHGVIFEGRGLGKQTGANGNQALNRDHNAILWMGGTSGVVVPSAKAIAAIQELIKYLRSKDVGKEIKGHRDGRATACPGDKMYALIKGGKLEPVKTVTAKPSPVYAPFPGKSFFRIGRHDPVITELGKALVRAGYKGYKVGPGPSYSRTDQKGVEWFQRKQGWTGSDADGTPGPETWKRLKVAKPKK